MRQILNNSPQTARLRFKIRWRLCFSSCLPARRRKKNGWGFWGEWMWIYQLPYVLNGYMQDVWGIYNHLFLALKNFTGHSLQTCPLPPQPHCLNECRLCKPQICCNFLQLTFSFQLLLTTLCSGWKCLIWSSQNTARHLKNKSTLKTNWFYRHKHGWRCPNFPSKKKKFLPQPPTSP